MRIDPKDLEPYSLPPEALASGWRVVDHEERCKLRDELERELPVGHRLKGATLITLARRDDCDDVLFQVGISPRRFAVVHLTWSVETRPDQPACRVYDSLEEWWGDEGGEPSPSAV